jgi:TolB protein
LLAFTSATKGLKVFDTNSEDFVFASGEPSDDQFSWAPDSAQITFHSLRNRDNRWEIFSVKLNGHAEPQQLTSDPARDNACAVWSPNGEYIAFASGTSQYVTLSVGDLFLMQPDGSSIEWLAGSTGKNWSECPYFSWSPDSQQIAMSDATDLMIVSVTNGTITLSVDDYCPIGIPAWSPNGKNVAFVSDFCKGSPDAEILVLDLATQNITQLTDNTAPDYFPVWSPDGKQIAFVSSRDGNEEIYLMQVDGSHQINLTNNPASDFYPSWQP